MIAKLFALLAFISAPLCLGMEPKNTPPSTVESAIINDTSAASTPTNSPAPIASTPASEPVRDDECWKKLPTRKLNQENYVQISLEKGFYKDCFIVVKQKDLEDPTKNEIPTYTQWPAQVFGGAPGFQDTYKDYIRKISLTCQRKDLFTRLQSKMLLIPTKIYSEPSLNIDAIWIDPEKVLKQREFDLSKQQATRELVK